MMTSNLRHYRMRISPSKWLSWTRGLLVTALVFGSTGQEKLHAPQGLVDRFYGRYPEEISVQLPSFHGIEPKLSIAYNFAFRDDLAGSVLDS